MARPGPSYGGTLRILAADSAFESTDPNYGTGGMTVTIGFTIYNNIVKLGVQGEILPELATSWDVAADGRSITFKLTKGVKFHDGTDFNAQAVKWNWDRIMDPSVGSTIKSRFLGVDRVEVANDLTVRIILKRPSRPFLGFLTEMPGMMLSPTAVQKYGGYSERNSPFQRNPVGTGPFIFKEWAVGDRVRVARNDKYWEEGKPYLDNIQWNRVVDASVRLAMLRTGEADIVDELRAEDLPLLQANPITKVDIFDGGRTEMLRMRVTKPPFDNKNLRAAIAYSIDREKFAQVMFQGLARPAYTFVQSGWAHNPGLRPYTLDLNKAKQKLAEAGYPQGVTIPVACESFPSSIQWCETIQSMLDKASIKVDIVLIPSGERTARFRQKLDNAGATRYRPTTDPHLNLVNIFGTGGGQNAQEDSNPEVDRLLAQAEQVYDIAEAKPLYDRIQTIIAEDASHVYLVWAKWITGLNKRVQNFQLVPDLDLRAREIWLSK